MKNSELKKQLLDLADSIDNLITEIEAAPAQEKTAAVKEAADFDFGKVSTTSKSTSSNPLLDFIFS